MKGIIMTTKSIGRLILNDDKPLECFFALRKAEGAMCVALGLSDFNPEINHMVALVQKFLTSKFDEHGVVRSEVRSYGGNIVWMPRKWTKTNDDLIADARDIYDATVKIPRKNYYIALGLAQAKYDHVWNSANVTGVSSARETYLDEEDAAYRIFNEIEQPALNKLEAVIDSFKEGA